jgi:hypothetical protein
MSEVTINKTLEDMVKSQIKKHIETLEYLIDKVKRGKVSEMVICSMDENGEIELNCCVKDRVSGIGILESGKFVLLDDRNNAQVD